MCLFAARFLYCKLNCMLYPTYKRFHSQLGVLPEPNAPFMSWDVMEALWHCTQRCHWESWTPILKVPRGQCHRKDKGLRITTLKIFFYWLFQLNLPIFSCRWSRVLGSMTAEWTAEKINITIAKNAFIFDLLR